eukprot:7339385-Alexandrium_andersonii.AAC.1
MSASLVGSEMCIRDSYSFVLLPPPAQAARFLISGALPDDEGEEPEEALAGHGGLEVTALLIVAL